MINKLKSSLHNREVGLSAEGRLRHFSVLIPLVEQDGKWFILFEKRSRHITQSSDICFPGGKVEAHESVEQAAIRETFEELLIDPSDIQLLGPLDLYIAHDNIIVHPFIGVLNNYQGSYQEMEVASVHLVSLDQLLNHSPEMYGGKLLLQLDENFPYSKIEGGKDYPWKTANRTILFYNLEELTIWGMTAQILKNALEIMKSI